MGETIVPIIFVLKSTNAERDIYFLIKENYFPLEGVQLLKTRLTNHVKFEEDWTREELVQIAKDTIEEYGATNIPFTLFHVKY